MTINHPASAQKIYQVYFLGGQSNMDGLGSIKDLPAELETLAPNIRIFHGNPAPDDGEIDGRGIWSPLRPGHGFGFSSDGVKNTYSDLFGVELSFAQRLLELQPSINLALIKYSRAATSIDSAASGGFGCWEPNYSGTNGVNQFDHFRYAVKMAIAAEDIDGDGISERLIPAGIVWMQGESDAAYSREIAERYLTNLIDLMTAIRAAFKQPDLPIVLGQISDSGQDVDGKVWDHGAIVRAAQEAYAENDKFATLVSVTDSLGYSDAAHYSSSGYLRLGRRFAEAILELQEASRK
ncbi:MAG: hypothetical protein H8E14_07995 [Candidatus Marinimicrobia bacterium]|nr:hypothetical protein [Candidatus Neomarinimicrobiota bacterium]